MPQELKTTDLNRVERVGPSGIYPASRPLPPGDAPVRGQGALAHPEERHDGGLQTVDSSERIGFRDWACTLRRGQFSTTGSIIS